jgi:GNAT superfamily N-acetyltransferase
MKIALAESEADIARCQPVMLELRPHLTGQDFVAIVRRQQKTGYLLAYLEDDGEVRSVAGYRFMETLGCGKILYVDDLVTHAANRSAGYGGRLFDWLVEQARAARCHEFHLDSGVQRFDAHRFYLCHGMNIVWHHFSLKLD